MTDVGEESRLRRNDLIQRYCLVTFCRICDRVRHRTGDLIGGEGEEAAVVVVPRAPGTDPCNENSARAHRPQRQDESPSDDAEPWCGHRQPFDQGRLVLVERRTCFADQRRTRRLDVVHAFAGHEMEGGLVAGLSPVNSSVNSLAVIEAASQIEQRERNIGAGLAERRGCPFQHLLSGSRLVRAGCQ